MSCGNSQSNINETFIIEPTFVGTDVLSACTAVYTNMLISCSGNTDILLGTDLITINGSLFTDNNVSATTVYSSNYFSGNTNLIDIFNENDIHVTGGTFNETTGVLTLNFNNNTLINITGFTNIDGSQYLLLDGSRPMSGSLNMGSNSIVSAGTINGVTIESHANRHQHGGADEVGSLIPSAYAIPKANLSGRLDAWVSTASTIVLGITKLSSDPENISEPIAVGVNDIRFLSAFTGLSSTNNVVTLFNISGGTQSFTTESITGGTYSNGTLTLNNNTGGTINISGFVTLNDLDVYITGGTLNQNTGVLDLVNSSGGTTSISGFLTNNSTVYVTDVFSNNFTLLLENNLGTIYTFRPPVVTGGTYTNGTLTLRNATGGTFNVTGFTNSTDIFVTGGTYSNGTAVFTNNSGGTFSVTGFTDNNNDISITGGTFNQNTRILSLNNNTGGTINISGITDTFVTGGTYSNGTTTFTNNSGGTFSVTGFTTNLVNGSGSVNYIPKWSATTALTISNIYDDGTNVGIFNSSPSYKLDVNGSVQLGSNSSQVLRLFGGSMLFQYNALGLSENRIYSSSRLHIDSPNSIRFSFGTVGGNLSVGTTEAMMYLGDISTTSGVKNGFGLSFRSLQSSGNGIVNIFNINPVFDQSSANTSTVRGFYYNPSFSQSLKGSNIAWESTSGDIIFGNLTGVTTQMVVADSTGKLSVQAIPSGSTSITDTTITGGTFNQNTRVLSLNNNTGGTINISGITDTFVTGGSYTATQILLENNTGGTVTINANDYTNWTDIGSLSTIVGFSAFTSRNIQYMIDGKTMHIQFDLRGSGSGSTTSFTIPNLASSWAGDQVNLCRTQNSTTQSTGMGIISPSTSTVVFYTSVNNGTANSWSAGVTRQVQGTFTINIA